MLQRFVGCTLELIMFIRFGDVSLVVEAFFSTKQHAKHKYFFPYCDSIFFNSGNHFKFPHCLLKEVDPGKKVIVIDSLSDLLIPHKPTAAANLIRKLKLKGSNKANLFSVLKKECLDNKQ